MHLSAMGLSLSFFLLYTEPFACLRWVARSSIHIVYILFSVHWLYNKESFNKTSFLATYAKYIYYVIIVTLLTPILDEHEAKKHR
jgi:hypothetical protein